MWQRVMFGTNDNPENQKLKDLSFRELAIVVPIVLFIVWIGIYPKPFLGISENATKKIVDKIECSYDKDCCYTLEK